jgi:hypothetical protein
LCYPCHQGVEEFPSESGKCRLTFRHARNFEESDSAKLETRRCSQSRPKVSLCLTSERDEKAREACLEALDEAENDLQYLWAARGGAGLTHMRELEYALLGALQKLASLEAVWEKRGAKGGDDESSDGTESKLGKAERRLQLRMVGTL